MEQVSRWNIECQCAPDTQLTGDNRVTILDKAQVVEPAHAEQVPVQSEKGCREDMAGAS